MKRVLMFLMTATLAGVTVLGCTKGYESQKISGDTTIALAAASYPLVKGDNSLMIKVIDASGKPATNARVDVRYYMPPMPGMAPMEYTSQAMAKGDVYAANANIAMEGGWRIDVTVNRPDKPTQTATFNVDAR